MTSAISRTPSETSDHNDWSSRISSTPISARPIPSRSTMPPPPLPAPAPPPRVDSSSAAAGLNGPPIPPPPPARPFDNDVATSEPSAASNGPTSSRDPRLAGRAIRFNPIASTSATRLGPRLGSDSSASRATTSNAGASTSNVAASASGSADMIDLTEEASPPTGNARQLPEFLRHRLSLPRLVSDRAGRYVSETLELSSGSSDGDSDDDDEIQVIEPTLGPLRPTRRATRANPGGIAAARARLATAAAAPADEEADAAYAAALAAEEADNAGGNGGYVAQQDEQLERLLRRIAGRDERTGARLPRPPGGGGGENLGGAFWRARTSSSAALAQERHEAQELRVGLDRLMYLYPNVFQGVGDHHFGQYLAGVLPNGGGGGGGWGGHERVRAGKKYAIKLSHPRKVESGFTRDIIEPIDPDAPPAPPPSTKARGKGKGKAKTSPNKEIEVVEMEPVCASCLEPLLLAQSGDQRPWALRCGHCVCGKCINEARARAKLAKLGGWEVDVDKTDVEDEDGDELEYVDLDATPKAGTKRKAAVSSATTARAKKKGKQKSVSDQSRVEDEWTSCPVVDCAGDATNLLAPDGHYWGPFELFV